MTTIGVAMATFNGAAHLDAQLESLFKQTSRPSELIVVDDRSSDKTLSLLQTFCGRAPFPVRILENESRLGYRATFIKAASLCETDVIAFCDQDDVWRPTKIGALQHVFSESGETLLVYHNSLITNENGDAVTTTFSRTAKDCLFSTLEFSPCLIVPGHAQAFRKSLNRFRALHSMSVDPYSENELMPHDIWMPFWASALGKVRYLSEVLVNYRMTDRNASGWPTTWRSFAADHIRNAQLYVRANNLSAINRRDLLTHARDLVGQKELAHLETALEYYQRLESKSANRITIYESSSILARSRAFLSFILQRNYHRGSKCHGIDALLLDLGIGVFRGWLGRASD